MHVPTAGYWGKDSNVAGNGGYLLTNLAALQGTSHDRVPNISHRLAPIARDRAHTKVRFP